MTSSKVYSSLVRPLFRPVDVASIVAFRVMFGGLMLWEVIRYLRNGWVTAYYILPEFHFKYFGFEWVEPWPGNGTVIHSVALGVFALCIALGFCYRIRRVSTQYRGWGYQRTLRWPSSTDLLRHPRAL